MNMVPASSLHMVQPDSPLTDRSSRTETFGVTTHRRCAENSSGYLATKMSVCDEVQPTLWYCLMNCTVGSRFGRRHLLNDNRKYEYECEYNLTVAVICWVWMSCRVNPHKSFCLLLTSVQLVLLTNHICQVIMVSSGFIEMTATENRFMQIGAFLCNVERNLLFAEFADGSFTTFQLRSSATSLTHVWQNHPLLLHIYYSVQVSAEALYWPGCHVGRCSHQHERAR